MDQVTQAMAAAAATDGGGVSPLFFVIGALALIVVSTLGPLSRIHERRAAAQRATSAQTEADARAAAASSDTDPAPHA
ncbi:MAG: hypothetical protein ABIR83_04825 [Nakamurella sp.]